MTLKNLFLLTFCIFILGKITFCQIENIPFGHLTNENGLSDASINCILQDNKGFMWFGANEGLNRYDGYEFTIFKDIPNDSLSLSNNRVETIFEDSYNNLWIGTSNGLNLYVREQGKFIRFFSNPNDSNSLSNNYIRQIVEDDGCLWIATLGGGVNHYDIKNNKFTSYRHDSTKSNTLQDDWVWTVFKDSKNRMWFGSFGISLLHRETGEFINYKLEGDDPAINRIRCFYEISENEFFVGTEAGLMKFFPNKKTDNFIQYIHNENEKSSISEGHVRKVFKDNLNTIWVAVQSGLDIYNSENNNFIHIQTDKNNTYSLSANEIWDIVQDNQNSIWFGTFKGGINILNSEQNKFKNWKHNPNNNKTLVSNSVLSFEENTDGTLWIGIDHGGLSLFDRNKGTLKNYRHNANDNKSLSSDAVLCLLNDSKDQLWTGSWAGGLNLFDKQKEQFTYYIPKDLYIKGWHVWDILEDHKGRIWIASLTEGISCYDTTEHSFAIYKNNEKDTNSLSHNDVWVLLEDSRKNIWAGTSTGLNRYNNESNNFTYYPYITNDRKTANSYSVMSIYEDSQQRFWIGTSGNGLNRLNFKNKTFVPFTENDGIINNTIYGILEDNKNSLWLSTTKGISKISIDLNDSITKLYNFDKKSGLQNDQFNRGASYKSTTGELFFGSSNGFVFFNPEDIKPNMFIPNVLITDFQIFNKKVLIDPTGKSGSPLSKQITETKKITMTHKQSVFSLKFAALNYISSEKNQYAYKLEGFDKTWNYVKNKREATYTNLDPGKYVFKVKASNNDGFWNEKPTELTIIILPPWWETWWFITIVIFTIAGSIIAFYLIRMRQMQERQKKLEQNVEERTLDLQEANTILEEKQEEIIQQASDLSETNEKLKSINNEVIKTNLHIKGSINYAQKLQNAILPIKKEIDKYFENFILYRPKDIVSGDFYWFHIVPEDTPEQEIQSPRILIAAADCTGHGVPGAIMSMIGNNLLNEAVLYKRLSDPAKILTHLNAGIIKALKQDKTTNDDGMDVCLCLIEKTPLAKYEIVFCGAQRPLIYYNSNIGKLETIKGNIKTVGGRYTGKFTFSNTEITLDKNDMLYLTSDGYIDQCNDNRKSMGSEKLKKNLLKIAKLPIDKQKLHLENVLTKYQQSSKQRDDITVLGIKL